MDNELSHDKNSPLTEAEMKYKALLMNVTKKRKDYPPRLAKHLGYSVRLKTDAVKAMKVELPPKLPIDRNFKLPEDYRKSSCEATATRLDELTKTVQCQISQMSKISEALSMINNNSIGDN